jgi:hypothetical protein
MVGVGSRTTTSRHRRSLLNITFAEWANHVRDLAEDLRKASRFTRVTHDDNSISIQGIGACCGTLELRSKAANQYGRPFTQVSSSLPLSGDPTEARSQLTRMGEVLDLLDYVHADTYRISVWTEGSCPCDMCGSKGTVSGAPCKACRGEGVR